jgi:hypothetical protein
MADVDDLRELQRFTQRIWSRKSRFHIGDLAWQFGRHPGSRLDVRLSLWDIDAAVMGWARLFLTGDVDLLVDPAKPELADEILAWAEVTAGQPITVTIQDTEEHVADALRRRGYQEDHSGAFFAAHSIDLSEAPAQTDLPAGFTVRAAHGRDDARRWVNVHREVWAPSTFDIQRYTAMAAGWPYRPEFNIVVEGPDGRFVAYCLGWYDEVNRVGLFEPVGTLEAYHRRGLSRAAGLALLKAFYDAGGRGAVVYPRGDDAYPIPRQVYADLGFTPHARTVRYHR